MTVEEFASKLNFSVLTKDTGLKKEVTGVYTGDLLSWVMSHAGSGDAWITIHTHLNIVAVALLTDVSCIIIPEGIAMEDATLRKAEEEGIAILGTGMGAYEICWRSHELLCS